MAKHAAKIMPQRVSLSGQKDDSLNSYGGFIAKNPAGNNPTKSRVNQYPGKAMDGDDVPYLGLHGMTGQ